MNSRIFLFGTNKPARDLILQRLNFIKNNTEDTFKTISVELIEILKMEL